MRTAMVRRKSERDGAPAYPFAVWGIAVPVEIVAETPHYYTMRVLPHHNPEGFMPMSKPYTITVDKCDVAVGIMEVKFK